MAINEQLALPLDETKHKTRTEIQELDIEALQNELQGLAGNTKVKVRAKRNQSPRVSLYETDQKTLILINTKKIRTQKQLDDVLEFCRQGVMPFN